MKLHSHLTAPPPAPPAPPLPILSRLEVGYWLLEVGCWMLDVGCYLGRTLTAVRSALARLPRSPIPVSRLPLLTALALLLGVPAAQAVNTLYNIQLLPNWGASYQSGAALIGSSGDTWNRMMSLGTYSGLATSANQSSSVDFSCSGTGRLRS